MKYYEYIYYRIHLYMERNGGSYNSTDYATSSLMSLCLLLNSMSILLLLSILCNINLFASSNKLSLFIGALVEYGFVHVLFKHLNREMKIIEYFSKKNIDNILKYEIIYWTYLLFSFVVPFVLMYFI